MEQTQGTDLTAPAGEMEPPAFARSAEVDVMGKLDDKLDELRMPGDVVLALERRWREDGYPNMSAWRRDLYYAALYGVEHVANLRANRIRRAMANVGAFVEKVQP